MLMEQRGGTGTINEKVTRHAVAAGENDVVDEAVVRAQFDVFDLAQPYLHSEMQRVCAHHLGIAAERQLQPYTLRHDLRLRSRTGQLRRRGETVKGRERIRS